MKTIKIGNKNIGIDLPVFFIAEAGVNHNGSLKIALKMVDVAKKAGADAIKFQTFKTSNLILPNAPKSKYHIETTGNDKKQTWFDLLKTQELSYQMHKKIIEYCKRRKIIFLSTPYDEESVDMLEKFKIKAYKVASTDNNNIPLLRYIAKKGKPMFISTAMANIREVQEAVRCVKKYIPTKFVLMQCTGNYPSKNLDSNLKVMLTYKKKFGCLYGYSDHTLDFINPGAATALGASVYEKHFTLDASDKGPDSEFSLEPDQLNRLCVECKSAWEALGSAGYERKPAEKDSVKFRRSIYVVEDIDSGGILTEENIRRIRPGYGLPPKYFNELIGKRVKSRVEKGTPLDWDMLEK